MITVIKYAQNIWPGCWSIEQFSLQNNPNHDAAILLIQDISEKWQLDKRLWELKQLVFQIYISRKVNQGLSSFIIKILRSVNVWIQTDFLTFYQWVYSTLVICKMDWYSASVPSINDLLHLPYNTHSWIYGKEDEPFMYFLCDCLRKPVFGDLILIYLTTSSVNSSG